MVEPQEDPGCQLWDIRRNDALMVDDKALTITAPASIDYDCITA
jgi:hypothetical protein